MGRLLETRISASAAVEWGGPPFRSSATGEHQPESTPKRCCRPDGRVRAPAVWLLLLVLLAVGARLPGVGRSLLGPFATKNCVYAMIARNWAHGRAPWFRPTIDQLVGGERGWHLTELPLPAYLPAAGWALLGGSLDTWGRATSIAWSACATVLLYLLMRRTHGAAAALAAGGAFALSPVSIIYGQSFMLESAVAALSILGFWANRRWWRGEGLVWLLVMSVAACLMLLTKPYMVILLAAFAAEASGARGKAAPDGAAIRRWRRKLFLWGIALFLAMLPMVVWCACVWSTSAPGVASSVHIYFSLRRSAADHACGARTLLAAEFYLQAAKNLCGPVLTPLGAALALLGLGRPTWRAYAPWLAACTCLVAALPLKFQELNYYYVVVMPPLCALVGLGFDHARQWLQKQSVIWRCGALSCLIAVVPLCYLRLAWRPAFVTPPEDRMVVAAAAAVRAVSCPADRVITMHGSTLSLLYYCDRAGWAIHARSPKFAQRWTEALAEGARWAIVTQPEQLVHLPQVQTRLATLRLVCAGDGYAIYMIGNTGPSSFRASR